MRRTRRRSRIVWKAWLALATVVSLVVGIWFSPVTAIRTVNVDGGTSDEHKIIYETAQTVRGIPALHVDRTKFESKLLALPWIASASFDRTPVSVANLKLSRRVMIARIVGSSDVGLAVDGTICKYPGLAEELPLLNLPKSVSGADKGTFPIDGPSLGVVSRVPTKDLVFLFQQARVLSPRENFRVDLDDAGHVSINISGGRVKLGDTSELERKLTVLKERMQARPSELGSISELNLSQPEQPTIVPKANLVPPSSSVP